MANARKYVIEGQPEKNKGGASKLFAGTVKLNSIQRRIEKFLEKWTRKRLNDLEIAQRFEKREKVINFSRWTNRFVAVGASILSLTGYPKIGGGIGLFCSLIEVLFSSLREKNEAKKREWGEFIKDCENLGDNLDELRLIIESLRSSLTGKLTNYLVRLEEKIYEFLKEHDKNNDGIIDVSELEIDKFALSLKKEWGRKEDKNEKASSESRKGKKKILREIVRLMQNLQKELINYRL